MEGFVLFFVPQDHVSRIYCLKIKGKNKTLTTTRVLHKKFVYYTCEEHKIARLTVKNEQIHSVFKRLSLRHFKRICLLFRVIIFLENITSSTTRKN